VKSVVRRNAVGVSGVVSAAALALVVAAVRGVIPAHWLPVHEPLVAVVPTLNAALSATALVTITVGLRAIRRGNVARHRAAMLTSTGIFASFLFLFLYLYRLVVHGTTEFAGPDVVYQFVYLPVLVVHMALAIVCVPLVVHALVLAGTHSVAELPRTNHPRVGKAAAALWLVSFALGIVVYLLLYVVY